MLNSSVVASGPRGRQQRVNTPSLQRAPSDSAVPFNSSRNLLVLIWETQEKKVRLAHCDLSPLLGGKTMMLLCFQSDTVGVPCSAPTPLLLAKAP